MASRSANDRPKERGGEDHAIVWLFQLRRQHSAGGQVVHRLLATQPPRIFEAVEAATSGWYMLLTLDLDYPTGSTASGLGATDVVRVVPGSAE